MTQKNKIIEDWNTWGSVIRKAKSRGYEIRILADVLWFQKKSRPDKTRYINYEKIGYTEAILEAFKGIPDAYGETVNPR